MKFLDTLNESNEDKYIVHLKPTLDYSGVTYQGYEINEISYNGNISIHFNIEVDYKAWGIRGISIYNFQGQDTIDFEVNYYLDEDNAVDVDITLPLNWSKIIEDKEDGGGQYTVTNITFVFANRPTSAWTSTLMNLSTIFIKEIRIETSK